MVDPSLITEHSEVVGADGEPVGTVDKLVIKLTKTDRAADGQHHVVPVDAVASFDNGRVVLSMSAAEAMQEGKSLST